MIAGRDHSIWAEVDPEEVEAMRENLDVFAAALPDSWRFVGGGSKHRISVGANAGMRLSDGGGGTEFMWTAQGLVGWRFGAKRNSAIFAGYRYRDMKYSKAEVYEVQKSLSGFGPGLRFGF